MEANSVMDRMRRAAGSPYRFLIVAAILAAFFCLLPIHADAPEQGGARVAQQTQQQALVPDATQLPGIPGVPAGADLSERTQENAYLHSTLRYLCGHSVQRREALSAQLVGLSRAAMEEKIGSVIPGARITGFSAQEVDIALELDIPCPLHWVLKSGENGKLQVLQNTTGEALSVVRETDIAYAGLTPQAQEDLLEGMIFDDVQLLEGYLENLDS